ncbi:hypothetical protein QWY28_11255 [Nocardioides sp. SOB77]|uniref:Uncharacterized protein n=1 Tax=Nocardioides oceani TaxID=3058369 RepID=A0ABT8FFQ9_9ACTN|nr:hypothetical protein [Nocardioides oceani]MDN4173524.1 hypothetical protein [Nocardioides oceani]
MLPPFGPRLEVVARRRPVELVRPLERPVAPYLAVEGDGPLTLAGHGLQVVGECDGAARLAVTAGGRTTRHRSRRHGRAAAPVERLCLALTGTHVTLLTREAGAWVARCRVDLAGRVDARDEDRLATLEAVGGRLGSFGQLGLRDLRVVTTADGAAYRPDGLVHLTATSAGPGFFDTAHTSVWTLDPATSALTHGADLFFRRPDRPGVLGDHATHLVRDGDRWLVATSTWGDFDRRRRTRVTLAETTADLLHGTHVLDSRELPLPTGDLPSVAVWDPHLVRTDEGWLVGFVNASRYFRFHPALAGGPGLDRLRLLGADPTPRECEGSTLLHLDGAWRLLASDRHERSWPVHDLAVRRTGRLDAPYPSNIPWPTLVPLTEAEGGGWLAVTFDGTRAGGPLAGYGTHGDVVVMRTAAGQP